MNVIEGSPGFSQRGSRKDPPGKGKGVEDVQCFSYNNNLIPTLSCIRVETETLTHKRSNHYNQIYMRHLFIGLC